MEKRRTDGVEYVLYTTEEHKRLQEMVLEQRELITKFQDELDVIQ